ncbi:hypothetical protein PVAP13_7KG029700 [Panicum virgatum]|uniref:O-methyltransferase dimerisation domain-containing protein n=1 Tax=Panicum virgatum TaxID=38727 RepID=A0A8T0QBY5_PANVG|nr:hypothetical protein PVAP13_7KG029700 [Panicum virgatum]
MSNPAVGAAGGDVEEATQHGLIDALSMAAGRAMTADELSAQLPAADKAEAAASVDRLLRFLACYNVVKCSTETSPSGEPLRQYTAAPVCRWLTSNSSEGSLAPLAKFAVDKDNLPSWNHLGAPMAGGGPAAFERAYGVPMF